MFEDSTFDTNGRIRTRSRGWMLATLVFNSSILAALIVIPLLFPAALPHQELLSMIETPALPTEPRPLPKEALAAFHGESEMQGSQIFAPPRIPTGIAQFAGPEAPPDVGVGNMAEMGPANGTGLDSPFHRQAPAIHPDTNRSVRIAGAVEAGLLVQKTVPQYPAIARAMGMQGTVVLEATISKSGGIENLRVVAGPAVLQQAALDAVRTWRYRPYLLDGEPVEVETTVNVIFTMNR